MTEPMAANDGWGIFRFKILIYYLYLIYFIIEYSIQIHPISIFDVEKVGKLGIRGNKNIINLLVDLLLAHFLHK